MWFAILITMLAASGNNIGKVLQKQATRNLPKLSITKREVVEQYLRSPIWLAGLLIDLGGALLMVVAFSKAPVSLVQPVSSIGLVVLLVFSHFYLEERLKANEWMAAGLALIGVLGLGVSAEGSQAVTTTGGGGGEQGAGKGSMDAEPGTGRILLSFLLLVLLLAAECHLRHSGPSPMVQKILSLLGLAGQASTLAGGGGGGGLHHTYSGSFSTKHLHTHSRDVLNQFASSGGHPSAPDMTQSSTTQHAQHTQHAHAVALDSALCGLEAGACFGLSAAASRTGFILAHKLKSPVWVLLGLGSSIGLTSSGFVLQTKGLKAGNTVVVCTMASVSSMVSGVAAGILALGERLPKSPLLLLIRFISWSLILVGTCLLAGGLSALRPILGGLFSSLPSLPPPGQGWIAALPPSLALPVRRMARAMGVRVNKGEEEGGDEDDFEDVALRVESICGVNKKAFEEV